MPFRCTRFNLHFSRKQEVRAKETRLKWRVPLFQKFQVIPNTSKNYQNY